jgi:hypothetical protein
MKRTDYKKGRIVKEMAKATGVTEGDVVKVLGQLGLGKIYGEVVRANRGQEPRLSTVKVTFRIGKSFVMV